ncbi:hypothetical protein [Dyella mobilis]|uniref:MASE1 domain-containing protein n=1 Tax=Dyella mobilis TaxID=1849582 RepID=A0ABS2KEA5_9GAMM|nr:hypothetical protein [Dyella mobilis]MBM7128678.1 hypothetical protein [Dyella mobilis]GLQ99001.1 hypothetical protein GCM10007863_34210 [Dyella mobilis]
MGKGTGARWREWLLQVVVALAYAFVYIAVHPISNAHWQIRTAVRLASLLLMPYRYWPAMLVAEAIPNAYEVLPCLSSLGAGFVAIRSVPPILPAMPVVWWFRRSGIFPAQRLIDVKMLLKCALIVTLVSTGYDYLSISFVHIPNQFDAQPIMALGYAIGNCIAIIGIVPIVLLMSLDIRKWGWRDQMKHMLGSKLTLDMVLFAVPSLALLSYAVLRSHDEDVKQVARMAMFAPVAWLTLKHGWRAAAVGGALAAACVCILTESRPEAKILEVQAPVMLAIGLLLATGARITAQRIQEERLRRGDVTMKRIARQTFLTSERRGRQVSIALERLAGGLHISNSQFIDQLRRLLPGLDHQTYAKQVKTTQEKVYELAESLHPLAWRERGLPAALNETIARALDEAGIAYRCHITGRGFIRMSPALLTGAYRCACEAVVLLSEKWHCTRISLTLRGGETNGKKWVVLRAHGFYSQRDVAEAALRLSERNHLAPRLGAIGLDREQLADFASVFNGLVHARSQMTCDQLTIYLRDAGAGAEVDDEVEPLRLWVD